MSARRTRRVETRPSLICSHNVIYDGLLLSLEFLQQAVGDCGRAVSFGMRFDDNRGSRLLISFAALP